MMIKWLLLLSLFGTQDGNGQEHGVLDCGPRNLTLKSSGQMIQLTWEDEPSCAAVQDVLIYQLVVLIADKQEVDEEVAVTPDQIGSTHSWNWTSYLSLECASHTVRLSCRYKNHTSPWKQEQTLPGRKTSTKPEVFPKDGNFKVGSRVTFCCVLPEGEGFNKMHLTGNSSANMNATKITNHVYALTVYLNQPSMNTCNDVICKTNTSENGACAYIGYEPDVRDLQCETQDLESVKCDWIEERKLDLPNNTMDYQLLGSPCAKEDAKKGAKRSCSHKLQVDVGERNWMVTAKNLFGKVEFSDTADLTKRVHMFPPKEVKASIVNARNVSLEWEWMVLQYNNLSITCQVNINHGENTIIEIFGVGLKFALLKDLIPNWTYNVAVRCRTTQHFWKWSDWSTNVNLHTKGDVPDALDVWMQIMDDQIITTWKMPLANQSHGHIIDFEVTWSNATDDNENRIKVAPDKDSFTLWSLEATKEYLVTVTARNINGSSPPSTITIPSPRPDRTRVHTSRITGSIRNLSWSASLTASCGYIVDWCPTTEPCIMEWLKVPPNETKATLLSKNFKEGLRYSLSIYGCTQGAPVLLERREGYVSEKRIPDGLFKSLKGNQQYSNYNVSWDPIPLREQTAFIQGYILYCKDDNNEAFNFSTDDPEATSLTARNLRISSYTFTVKAKTAVGECGSTFITATLNASTDNVIASVFISLVSVFGVLSLITILCYRHWTCIKQKVYPPIPKPVLTSPGHHTCRPLHVDQCLLSEAEVVDVAELHSSAGAPRNCYTSQNNMPFVFTQTLKGYYNQPLNKCTPPAHTPPTTAVPAPSELPASPFRRVFPNPSYDLIMQPPDQHSGPELQVERLLEKSSSEYQPHVQTGTFRINQTEKDPESRMNCVSAYILLPQSASM